MKKRLTIILCVIMIFTNNLSIYAEELTVKELQEKIESLEERIIYLEDLLISLGFMKVETDVVETVASGDITLGMKNALGSANSYLSIMGMSYKSLITQLEFDGYTNEEAVYAANNCGADWNEEAAESAKSYLSILSLSKDGLIQQLEFDGFTSEQAIYAATANGY